MSDSSTPCTLCGYAEADHDPDGLAPCSAYEPVLKPRVYIPAADELSGSGRDAFKSYDPTLDYIILEVPAEDWTSAYLLAAQDGGFVVAEIRVFPTEPASDAEPGTWSCELGRVPRGGLTARRLRSIGLVEHRAHSAIINDTVRAAMGDAAFDEYMKARGVSAERLSAFDKVPELSNHRLTRLAQIAGLYVTAANVGHSSPVAAAAERLGLPRSVVRDHLHAAREAGLLTGSGVGVAGGMLTTRARNLLDPATEEEE